MEDIYESPALEVNEAEINFYICGEYQSAYQNDKIYSNHI